MANWWDAAPLAQPEAKKNWWENAPLAQQAPQATPQNVGPQMPDNGAMAAAGRGAAQGATFGFNDEMIGLSATPGDGESLLQGIIKYISGDKDAVERYNAATNAQRAQTRAAEEQHPIASTVGNVAGAIAVPIGGAVRGATIGGRALNAARVGAVTGALAGAGEGEGAVDTAAKAAGGAVLGGAIGGVAAPVIEGGTRAVGALASQPLSYLRAARDPRVAAETAVGRAAQEAQRVDPNAANRLTQADVGGPVTVMDTLGAPGRDLARGAGNLSGEARDTLNNTLQPRYEGQGGRVIDWLRNTFNFRDAHATEQALEGTKRGVNNAAYRRAYQEGAEGIWSPELERLAGSDAVSAAMRKAASSAGDEAIVSGYGAMNPRITFTQDGRMQFNRAPNGMPTYPDLQYWDLVRRELSDAAQRAGHGTSEARRLNSFAGALNTELDRVIPSYQQARQGAAAFFGAENALEAGQNFVTQNFAIPQTRAALARMSPTERQLFQDGFLSRYVETLEKIPDRADVVRRIYESPAARQKIQLVLGQQRANELEAVLRVENVMQQSLRGVTGNSTTAQQLATMGLAGGGAFAAGGSAAGLNPQDASIAGVVGALTAAGKRGIDIRVARHVAEMLASNDPAVLQRAVRTIANNPRLLSAFRAADTGAARLGGQNAPALPALQGPSASYAGGDQPEIPRPPGQ